jgi:hypothetical protein
VLAVQDTASLNYGTHEKTEGTGYISDKEEASLQATRGKNFLS